MDYLDAWHKEFTEYKWKNALINDKYMKNLYAVYLELRNFFPANDFADVNPNKDNWLLHILANKKLSSVQVVTEMAELLRYYQDLYNKESYNLKLSNGSVNYREFNEKMFELLLNYAFKNVGLNPLINQNYLDKENNKKQIDILLKFDNYTYNVEITKYYDSISNKVYELSLFLKRHIEKKSNKKQIRLETLFTGYIAFQTSNEIAFGEGKKTLIAKIDDYFHSFLSNTMKITNINIKKPEFEILIQPEYLNAKDSFYHDYLEQFPYSIFFKFKPTDFLSQTATFSVTGQTFKTNVQKNEALAEKIKKKIYQHRDFTDNLLIVISIENNLTTHHKGAIPPIRHNEVDSVKLCRLLKPNMLVVLLFKEIYDNKINVIPSVIGHLSFHSELISYLKRMNFDIQYSTK